MRRLAPAAPAAPAALALVLAIAALAGGCGPPLAPAAARAPSHALLQYRYMTDTPDGRRTRSYGYNLVDLGPYRGLIDALPAGQRALVWLGGYSKATCSFAMSDGQASRALAGLAGDPKVAGYYLADEADDARPAFGGRCLDVAAQVTARSRLVHRLAPGTFTYEVVAEAASFPGFAHATDVLGTDPYPCRSGRRCDWTEIPRYIAALRAAHVARYWGVLQAFSGGGWRYPTPAELLTMIRQWERSGWQGEQTFAWDFAGHQLTQQPALLAILRELNTAPAGAGHQGFPGAGRAARSPPRGAPPSSAAADLMSRFYANGRWQIRQMPEDNPVR